MGIVTGGSVLAQEDVVIGYSAPGLVGAQAQIQAGLVNGAEAKGWEVLTTTSGGDPQKQLNDIRDFIAQGVDAIVAVPDDSAGICLAVQEAKDAGIPFYTIDRSPSGCEITMTVLSDNYMAGQQSGEAIVEFLTERHGEPRGTVLEITGNLAQNVAQLRGGGFNDVISQYPDITVISKVGDWDSAKATDIVRDVATTEADLDAIYMHSDCAYGPSVVQTLNEVGRAATRDEEGYIFLAGVDGCLVALDFIRDGVFGQSSNQPIPDFGALAVRYIEQELSGQPIEPGEVTEEGALWSPARIEDSEVGPQLFLATTSVGPDNVDDERLWGNIEKASAAQ
jgi:ABC-type sugar transport system substrate-binding protein